MECHPRLARLENIQIHISKHRFYRSIVTGEVPDCVCADRYYALRVYARLEVIRKIRLVN